MKELLGLAGMEEDYWNHSNIVEYIHRIMNTAASGDPEICN